MHEGHTQCSGGSHGEEEGTSVGQEPPVSALLPLLLCPPTQVARTLLLKRECAVILLLKLFHDPSLLKDQVSVLLLGYKTIYDQASAGFSSFAPPHLLPPARHTSGSGGNGLSSHCARPCPSQGCCPQGPFLLELLPLPPFQLAGFQCSLPRPLRSFQTSW